ncbi:hypothetical protein QBC34DRAFT_309117, partial [Podospora aff. communis PSN243]
LNRLVTHGRTFLLADHFDIPHLRDLAFYKMGVVLSKDYGNPKAWQVDHVVELVELCYEEDRLARWREAVVLYAACRLDVLWEDKSFRTIVGQRGELAMDLIGALVGRLQVC